MSTQARLSRTWSPCVHPLCRRLAALRKRNEAQWRISTDLCRKLARALRLACCHEASLLAWPWWHVAGRLNHVSHRSSIRLDPGLNPSLFPRVRDSSGRAGTRGLLFLRPHDGRHRRLRSRGTFVTSSSTGRPRTRGSGMAGRFLGWVTTAVVRLRNVRALGRQPGQPGDPGRRRAGQHCQRHAV